MQMASEETLLQLEQQLRELEHTLNEVHTVSGILESGSRGRLKPGEGSAEILAAEVGEDLIRWREQREREDVETHEGRQRRLREVLETRKAQGERRHAVEIAVRKGLFNDAVTSLSNCTPTESDGDPYSHFEKGLDLVIRNFEDVPADLPAGLVNVANVFNTALGRKRARGEAAARRARLSAITGQIDADLLASAQASTAKREGMMKDQADRIESFAETIFESLEERHMASEEMNARARTLESLCKVKPFTCLKPGSQVGAALAMGLHNEPTNASDSTGKQSIAAAARKTRMPRGTVAKRSLREGNLKPITFSAEALVQDLVAGQLRTRGEERVAELCKEYRRRHMPESRSVAADEAQSDLNVWEWHSRNELLGELLQAAKTSHEKTLARVRAARPNASLSSVDQLTRAVSMAEEYHKIKTDLFDGHRSKADGILHAKHYEAQTELSSRRRRMEVCALKRWEDIRMATEGLMSGAKLEALLQLGEAAQRLVVDCHSALPLPDSFAAGDDGNISVRPSSLSSGRSPTECREIVEHVVSGLPSNAETCAVIRKVLCMIDTELQLLGDQMRVRRNNSGLSS